MRTEYDRCVDARTLDNIQQSLSRIGVHLNRSTDNMIAGLQQSRGFLSGMQFEKAKQATQECINSTTEVSNAILDIQNWIEQLKETVEEYAKCGYGES